MAAGADATILFTGFPGFIGMRLLPRLTDLAPGARLRCLVQALTDGVQVVRADVEVSDARGVDLLEHGPVA